MKAFAIAPSVAPLFLGGALVSAALAHPGAGIVVDEQGQVFFADLSRGLLKIDAAGKATSIHKEGGHWLALDSQGSFSRMNFALSDHWPRWFKRRTAEGVKPALITDGGSPLVIGRDGNLYYVCDDEKMIPGGLQIARLSPDGMLALLNPKLREISEKLGGIKGLACGPDGSLYATYPKAVLKIGIQGQITTLVNPVVVADCEPSVPLGDVPFLRGLAVDSRGLVYVAASGCGSVIKITPDGKVATVLKAEKPWAPCGVAVQGDDLYVLEHINANSEVHEDWPPRVRRMVRDGSVVTLFTAAEKAQAAAASDRPLLVPASGSPVPAAGGGLAAADVNGDGCADLVLGTQKSLKVFFGSRQRAWPREPDVAMDLATGGNEIVLADINHDAKPDVVLADHDTYGVTVLLGDGSGRFQPSQGSPFVARVGDQPHTHGLVIADLNEDGHPDIVTANNSDGDLSVLLGDGKGKFIRAAKSPFPCGASPYPIATTDINGDGHADVLIPNATRDSHTLTILLGNGRGELAAGPNSPLACDVGLWYVATGDLNGDQRADVVAMHGEGSAGVTILLNAGQGQLSPASSSPLALSHGAWGVEIADMNRDSKADLVVAAAESIQLFLGDGRGGFTPAAGSPYPTGKGAWRLTVGDFNGDGKLDVATKCVEAGHIAILFGN